MKAATRTKVDQTRHDNIKPNKTWQDMTRQVQDNKTRTTERTNTKEIKTNTKLFTAAKNKRESKKINTKLFTEFSAVVEVPPGIC